MLRSYKVRCVGSGQRISCQQQKCGMYTTTLSAWALLLSQFVVLKLLPMHVDWKDWVCTRYIPALLPICPADVPSGFVSTCLYWQVGGTLAVDQGIYITDKLNRWSNWEAEVLSTVVVGVYITALHHSFFQSHNHPVSCIQAGCSIKCMSQALRRVEKRRHLQLHLAAECKSKSNFHGYCSWLHCGGGAPLAVGFTIPEAGKEDAAWKRESALLVAAALHPCFAVLTAFQLIRHTATTVSV